MLVGVGDSDVSGPFILIGRNMSRRSRGWFHAHGLTVAMGVIAFCSGIGCWYWWPEGPYFDLSTSMLGGFGPLTIYNLASGFFNEINKPDE